MAWQSLKITVGRKDAERLSELLADLGALAVSIEDAQAGTRFEQPIFGEPSEPEEGLWAQCVVDALLPETADAQALLAAARAQPIEGIGAYSIETVDDEDWVRLTQSQFDPIRISERMWIVPSWHAPVSADAVNLMLDPGLAFGTGSHPTTRMCLQWLDRHLHAGEALLDYGCGSGILAIAAAKLGAAPVLGVDIDPQAVAASRTNALRNEVDAEFWRADEAPAFVADVTIANILTNPLKILAPVLAGSVRPGGRLVLTGILAAQAGDVVEAYSAWLPLERAAEAEGWVLLAGTKGETGRRP
ncbi:MAG: 50S ribosomal protein L11 methyltransferase [Betaproteobacteria bacterium]|nr:50S ribosomal protein L11 methyltransferase [Betaproteobacteria bacterium]